MSESLIPATRRPEEPQSLTRPHWLLRRGAGLLAFLIPVLMAYSFDTPFGRSYPTDLLLLLLVPMLIRYRWLLVRERVVRYFLGAGVVWLAGVMVADLLAGSPMSSVVRGWGEIVLTLLAMGVLAVLVIPKPTRILVVFAGIAVGSALHVIIWPTDNAVGAPWRLGGVTALVIGVVVLSRLLWPSRGRVYYAALLVGLASVAALLLSRGTGLILVLATCILLVSWVMERSGMDERKRRALLLVAVAVGPVVMLFAYSFLAQRGYLGQEQQQRYVTQASGEFGVVLGARKDLVGGLLAIWERPIIGNGSRPEDPLLVQDYVQTLYELGYRTYEEDSSIPSHSALLGSWAAGGILVLPFWVGVGVVAFVAIVRSSSLDPGLQALVLFIALSAMWSTLFSPFGGRGRVSLAAAIVLFAVSHTIEQVRDRRRAVPSHVTL